MHIDEFEKILASIEHLQPNDVFEIEKIADFTAEQSFILIQNLHTKSSLIECMRIGFPPSSVLLFAACIGNIEAIEWLLQHDDSLTEKNNSGDTPLMFAAKNGQIPMVEWLLLHGASLTEKNNSGDTPLMFAAKNSNVPMVECLLKHGASPNEKNEYGDTPLMFAARYGQIPTFECLLKNGASLTEKNNDGYTPLMIATSNGEIPMVECLLQHSASLTEKNNSGDTPLILAAVKGNVPMMKCLLQRSPSLTEKNNAGYTPLMIAAKNGSISMVECLIQCGASLTEKNNVGNTPLFFAAFYGRGPMVEWLLQHAVSPNEKNNYGDTPLMMATSNGQIDIAKQLLQHGASLTEKNNEGNTPLMFAARNGQIPMVEWLLKNGALLTLPNTIDLGSQSSQQALKSKEYYDLLFSLFNKFSDPSFNEQQFNQQFEVLNAIHPTEPNFYIYLKNENLDSVLHQAARAGNLNMIEHLFKVGKLDFEQKNTEGFTPLDVAIKSEKENAFLFTIGQALMLHDPMEAYNIFKQLSKPKQGSSDSEQHYYHAAQYEIANAFYNKKLIFNKGKICNGEDLGMEANQESMEDRNLRLKAVLSHTLDSPLKESNNLSGNVVTLYLLGSVKGPLNAFEPAPVGNTAENFINLVDFTHQQITSSNAENERLKQKLASSNAENEKLKQELKRLKHDKKPGNTLIFSKPTDELTQEQSQKSKPPYPRPGKDGKSEE